MQKTVLVIGGPTASGKTGLAIQIAKHFNTEIISADSRQCYQELVIGVARPTTAQLAQVPHSFIASHSIHTEVTAATFEAYALSKTKALFAKHDVVVMVGGTGLYIKAFCEGLDAVPPVPEHVRMEVRQGYESNGLAWLQQQAQALDPIYFSTGEIHNPQRLMRVLEVATATGKSILHFQKGEKAKRGFNIVKIALALPKESLHHNINTRVEEMMEDGLLEEVRSLLPYKHLNALQTVGYRELFDYLEGKYSLPHAIEKLKIATRQYAKRQITWFKKDASFTWFAPFDTQGILHHVHNNL